VTASPAAPEQIFDVDDFEQWHGVVGSTLAEASMHCDRPASFAGRIRRLRVGRLELVDMTASAHVATRTPRDAGPDGPDEFILSLQIAGSEQLAQHRRTATLQPGDFALYDASRPFFVEASAEFRGLNVRLSASRLGIESRQLQSLSARRIAGATGLAPIVSTLLRNASETFAAAAQTQPRATIDAAEHTVTLIRDLLLGCLEERGDIDPGRRRRATEGDRIVDLMLARLADPGLRAEDIARDSHLSLRQLHRIFAVRGESFATCLRRLRLERAAAELGRLDFADLTIADIAARWGFVSPGHFSQVFRQHTGSTPMAYRHAARSDHAVGPRSLSA
jgi:AraC-like DNA-binding protein